MAALIIFLAIGYLLGSLSPGYLFGRIVRSIDVREFGNKNTGAANTYRLVGPAYGIIAGIFDALKAAAAYFIAIKGPIGSDTAILVGIAAVAGHIWPFYLQFKGGRGAASLAGLCVTVLFFTQSIFALILVISALTFRIIDSEVITFEAPARKLLKLGGLIFPLGLIWLPRELITRTALVLFAGFFVFDLLRFFLPKINTGYLKLRAFAKEKELKRFSGYTLFLFSIFAVSKLFDPTIAVISLIFFIIGDILAPLGKKAFLPIKLSREKTVGGALLVFVFATVSGVFLDSLTPLVLNRQLIIVGALIVATLDQLSFLVDDNILVPIGTALALSFLF